MAAPDALIAAFIPASAVVAILFAVFLWKRVAAIQMTGGRVLSSQNGREYLLEEEQRGGEEEVRVPPCADMKRRNSRDLLAFCSGSTMRISETLTLWSFATSQIVAKAADIQKSISEGASSFLATEYYYLGIFMVRWMRARRFRCVSALDVKYACPQTYATPCKRSAARFWQRAHLQDRRLLRPLRFLRHNRCCRGPIMHA